MQQVRIAGLTSRYFTSGEDRDPDTSRSERDQNDFNRLFDTPSAPLYDDFIIDLDDDLLDDDDMDDMFASDMGYRLMAREFSPDSVVSSGHVTPPVVTSLLFCRCDVVLTVVCV